MAKKKTSFTLDTSLLKDLKMKAVQLETTQSKLIEKYINESLNEDKEPKIKGDNMSFQVEDIEPNLLKAIRNMAKNEDLSEKETINILLKEGIKVSNKEKVEEIENNNLKLKFMKKTRFEKNKKYEEMFGIEKSSKAFDSVEMVKEVRHGDEKKLINSILKEEIEKEPIDKKIQRLSGGKAKMLNKDTYNPNSKKLNSLKGVIQAPKGFDVVKAVEDANIRNR